MTYLYIDQYGHRFYARTVKDLRAQIGNGGSRVSRMYQDKIDGTTVCVGYVIGIHWLHRFAPVEVPFKSYSPTIKYVPIEVQS